MTVHGATICGLLVLALAATVCVAGDDELCDGEMCRNSIVNDLAGYQRSSSFTPPASVLGLLRCVEADLFRHDAGSSQRFALEVGLGGLDAESCCRLAGRRGLADDRADRSTRRASITTVGDTTQRWGAQSGDRLQLLAKTG